MAPAIDKAHDAAEIRALLDYWAKATRAKDVEGILANYMPGILSFDCHSQLQLKEAEAHRKHLDACLSCMQGPMIFEIHDLDVTAQDDVAFCHYLARCGATGADGEEHCGWLRVTVCLRKTNGRWMIVHGHCSAPFDPASGKALLELEPEHEDRASAA
jgi:uncharacterized protein (TIGR02246 family)